MYLFLLMNKYEYENLFSVVFPDFKCEIPRFDRSHNVKPVYNTDNKRKIDNTLIHEVKKDDEIKKEEKFNDDLINNEKNDNKDDSNLAIVNPHKCLSDRSASISKKIFAENDTYNICYKKSCEISKNKDITPSKHNKSKDSCEINTSTDELKELNFIHFKKDLQNQRKPGTQNIFQRITQATNNLADEKANKKKNYELNRNSFCVSKTSEINIKNIEKNEQFLSSSSMEKDNEFNDIDHHKSEEATIYLLLKINGSNNISNISNVKQKGSIEYPYKIFVTKNDETVEVSKDFFYDQTGNVVNIIPNLSYVITILPEICDYQGIIFDPFIARWLKNTACYMNINNIMTLDYFDLSELKENLIKEYNEFSKSDLFDWYRNVEIPHLMIVNNINFHSFKIDINKMHDMRNHILSSISSLEETIYEICGERFNVMSPFEVNDVLSRKCNNKQNICEKTPSHQSRSKVISRYNLNGMASDAKDKISEYRALKKLLSNWLSYDKFTDENQILHPAVRTLSTATGRTSLSNPNIQNIPCEKEYNIRSLFLPPSKRYIISLEYYQLELRILVHFSDEKELIDICENKSTDLDTDMAKVLYNIGEVTDEMRENSKAVIQSIIHGKPKDLEKIKLPGLQKFATQTSNTKLKSILGEIRSTNKSETTGTIIQRRAADFMKFSIVNIWNSLKMKPIHQVHNEIIFEIDLHKDTDQFQTFISNLSLSAECSELFGLKVSIPFQLKFGETYGDLHYI